jgi:DnaJ-class molecular chaperone
LKYHPDKDDSPAASVIFARVAEAFEVLSSSPLKALFDVLGEVGLKQGVPDGKGNLKGGHYKFDVSPVSVFEQFHGTQNPYRALMDVSNAFEQLGRTGFASVSDGEHGAQRTFDVFFTLEELHSGVERRVEHVRKTQSTPGGAVTSETRTLTLRIPPGCEHGRRFVFENEGNSKCGVDRGPVVYVANAKTHAAFSRAGDDLVFVKKMSLIDGLCGCVVTLVGIDGVQLTVPVTDVVDGGSTKVVAGEGMARLGGVATQETGSNLSSSTSKRGDLLVVFDLVFPRTMSPTQRALLRAAFLFPKSDPQKEHTKAATAFLLAANDGVKGWSTGGK